MWLPCQQNCHWHCFAISFWRTAGHGMTTRCDESPAFGQPTDQRTNTPPPANHEGSSSFVDVSELSGSFSTSQNDLLLWQVECQHLQGLKHPSNRKSLGLHVSFAEKMYLSISSILQPVRWMYPHPNSDPSRSVFFSQPDHHPRPLPTKLCGKRLPRAHRGYMGYVWICLNLAAHEMSVSFSWSMSNMEKSWKTHHQTRKKRRRKTNRDQQMTHTFHGNLGESLLIRRRAESGLIFFPAFLSMECWLIWWFIILVPLKMRYTWHTVQQFSTGKIANN